MTPIPFQHSYAALPERFFASQKPAQVPNPELIRVNKELAQDLGLDDETLSSLGAHFFSGNELPAETMPIAQAYAGHQFGGFSPQLGDGRAILLGELNGRDIQLKGSGRTPFSRGGDGKSALGPVIREYLLSEAMYALGVPTTRALAAVSTGETVLRQEGEVPGGVFTRVAASHLRVGTFQFFAARQDKEALQILSDYAIRRHFPEAQSPLELLKAVITKQAALVAHWMSLGFIHGVMNTDNCSVSGETIDYGPCAFMDTFHPQTVFSSIDRGGRYSWENQAMMAHWNLTRFAETLLPLMATEPEEAVAMAEQALAEFKPQFKKHYLSRFRCKLGLHADAPEEFLDQTLGVMANEKLDFTLFFRELTRHAAGEATNFFDRVPTWLADWKQLAAPTETLAKMRQENPILIPRNHQVEAAIQAAYQGDFSVFHRLTEAWQHPYEEQHGTEDLERPPLPDEVVTATFCGT